MKSVRRLARVHLLLLRSRKLLRRRAEVERPVVQAVLVAHRKGAAVGAAAEAHLKLAVRLLRVELPVAAELLAIQSAAPQFGEKVRIRRSLPELRR